MPQDFLIIGGGVVGMAVAYGLARRGRSVTVLDGHDDSLRASRGNAGLVWVQGKGLAMPRYAELSLHSSMAWPEFAEELTERTRIDLEYEHCGGVDLCFDAKEAQARQAEYRTLYAATPSLTAVRWEYLDREALREQLPGLGERVHGGTFSPHDGQCNPLYLLRALYAACLTLGVDYHPATPVTGIEASTTGFTAHSPQGSFSAERVILAAGLGARTLAPPLGLSGQVHPVRGQVLVTERFPPSGRLPTPQLRQTASGGYLIGDVLEDAGYDTGVTLETIHRLGQRAVQIYPELAQARLVRSWGALRVMTPDGSPLYEASRSCPGAYNLSCHSGITLAAFHARELAEAIDTDRLATIHGDFSGARFDVQTTG
ncbi:NAD(P)/FAD-dependent oxidoreductase [Halomonas sp. NCCP-2165]|nr:FAD-dependent oxidoreductase [Halomonas sp. NCCP-2165]GKW47946.1 FAD-dependent oxidoreductase [Halomonas sp. NCCP-2165]